MALVRRRARSATHSARSSGTALVAASTPIEKQADKRHDTHIKKIENWQRDAWMYVDNVPEVGYAMRFTGNNLAALRLFPAFLPDANSEPVAVTMEPFEPGSDAEDPGYTEQEAQACFDALDRLRSTLGGRTEIQRRLGQNMFVTGDCYLLAQPHVDANGNVVDDGEDWDIYSVEEVEEKKGAVQYDAEGNEVPVIVTKGPDGRDKPTPPGTTAFRVWRPHARFREWADSPLRSVGGVLEELLLLTLAIRAGAESRLKGSGLLLMPSSMRDLPADPNAPEGDGQASLGDQMVKDMIEVAAAAKEDPGSAAANVPMTAWLPDSIWEKMIGGNPLIQWNTDIDRLFGEQRAELVQRFATGIDFPPEIITGKAAINHWGQWNIDDNTWRHMEPLAQLSVDALTVCYYRSALQAEGIEDVDRFCIWYDASKLVADPDETEKTLEAHDRFLASDEYTRDRLRIPESAKPTDEEIDERIRIIAAKEGRAAPGKSLPSGPTVEGPPQQQALLPGATTYPAIALNTLSLVAAAEPPGRTASAMFAERIALADLTLLRDVHAKCEAEMHRVLERANNRLLRLANKDPLLRVQLRSTNGDLLHVAEQIGAAGIRRLTAATDDAAADASLLAGAFTDLPAWFDERVTRTTDEGLDAAQQFGTLTPGAAEQYRAEFTDDREAAARQLVGALTEVAGSLLRRPEPPPLGESDGSLVPFRLVRQAIIRAGGGDARPLTAALGTSLDAAVPPSSLFSADRMSRMFFDSEIHFRLWEWAYGPVSWRQRPFKEHLALDGLQFNDENDEALANKNVTGSGYGWPGVSGYWPGDHDGCQCTIVPTDVVLPRISGGAVDSPSGFAKEAGPEDEARGTYVYRSEAGRNTVRIQGKFTPDQVDALLSATQRLVDTMGKRVNVDVSPISTKLGPGVGGVSSTGGHSMQIAPATLRGKFAGKTIRDVVADAGAPAGAQDASLIEYVVTHEYGHLLDGVDVTVLPKGYIPPSRYGRVDDAEGFAEGFADWFLSHGGTANKSVQALAEQEGWTF